MKQINRYRIAVTICLLFTVPCLNGADGSEMVSHIPADYTGKPITGTPHPIPGIIQAESYDVASGDAKGVTVGYERKLHKTEMRPGADSVGLGRFGSGHVSTTGEAEAPDQVYVGWTETGQWLAYTVQVSQTATYVFGGKFAAGGKGSILSVTFTPDLVMGPIEIPTTAGYQPGVEVYHVWEKLENLKELALPAGVYVMKVKIEANAGLNLDYFIFTKKS
jgi:hypothetical protein